MTVDALQEIAAQAVALAQSNGADQVAVAISQGEGLGVNVRQQAVETIEYYQDQSLSITVYRGKRLGTASITDFSERALQQAIRAACNIAQFTEEDSCAGLPDQTDIATEWPDLDLCTPWDIDVDQAIEMAKQCESAGLSVDKRIHNSDGAEVSKVHTTRVFANSYGFNEVVKSSRHHISCALLAESQGQMEQESDYTIARDPSLLDAVEVVGKRAGEAVVARLDAQTLATQKVPVVFRADIASGLLQHWLSAIEGGRLYREASFLLNSAGKQIFPDWMKIQEDPFIPKGLSSCPYDAEAVRVAPRLLVDQGVLQGYLLSSYTARKLGMPTTGNAGGAHNILVESTLDGGLAALLKQMDRGLLVTGLMGQGVNLVTGDYSRGANGFWVEHGEIQYPVHEITIASNLRDMFQQTQAVADDLEKRSLIRTGSILIDDITVAGGAQT